MADNHINEVSNVGTRIEGAGVDASQFQVGRFSMENAMNNPTINVGGGADDFPMVDLIDEQADGGNGGRAADDNREGRGAPGLNEQQDNGNRMHEQIHNDVQNEAQAESNGVGTQPNEKKIIDPLKKKPLGDKHQQGGEGSGSSAPETTTMDGAGGTGTSDGAESGSGVADGGKPPVTDRVPGGGGGSTAVEPSVGGTIPGGKPPIKDKGLAGE